MIKSTAVICVCIILFTHCVTSKYIGDTQIHTLLPNSVWQWECANLRIIIGTDSTDGIWYSGHIGFLSLKDSIYYTLRGFKKGSIYPSWYIKDSVSSDVFFLRPLQGGKIIQVGNLDTFGKQILCSSIMTLKN
ncbi:MAG: hypothetical protein IPP06_15280 [Saprospiraceae bacterium]|nr:hypothetical protein [Candidatus Vicinibacter affinis]